jgi:hypothetical protein
MVARVHEGAVPQMKTMDEMAEDEASWPLLRDLLRSGQVPADRVAELVIEHPAFADWYVGRKATHEDIDPWEGAFYRLPPGWGKSKS